MLKLKLTALLALLAIAIPGLKAQVTSEPTPLYDNSQDVVIYFHADQGNKGLANLPESTPVYVHTGVVTSSSKDDSDWKYATKWLDNSDKYKLTYVSPNLYSLNIGDIKKFYGITSKTEVIKKLLFVFRNATGTKEGKGTGGKDITLDVISTALQMDFTKSIEGSTVTMNNPQVTFNVKMNEPVDKLSIVINLVTMAETENASELEFTYTVPKAGRYNVYANAEKDGVKISQNFTITAVEASEEKEYPGGVPKMGPVRNADGTVTFCLAAPQKESVDLVASWLDYDQAKAIKMYKQKYQDINYFWTTVSGLDAESMYFYYFLVDGTYRVGDPYARLILDPFNDKYIPADVYPGLPDYPSAAGQVSLAVYQENINDYDWTDSGFRAPDKKDLVIYEMLFRDFTGTEGKARGDGTVRQAIEKIPYLKSLGINAVELLPINEFNGNISWGYNPNFYFAPDKAYGTPDDYKEFINTCHENGIAVILDMVFNQTDWQHPWYVMYPTGQNPMYNADAPHAYSVLNDWNQGHPLVRQQWKDVVKYWIEEYHVDGYRFDLVKGLGDNDSYANNGDAATNAYNASRVANMKAIKEAMDEVKPDAYFINENLAGAKEENEMAALGMLNWANVNNEGCQYAMGIANNSGLARMWAVKNSRTEYSTVAYLESHDEERLAYKQTKWGISAVRNDHQLACRRLGSAAAQMILVPGAHMIWQFSEMGNSQTTKNANGGNNTDPKIVNWALLDDPDNHGLYENYCELIRLRTLNPDLFSDNGSYAADVSSASFSNPRTITSSTSEKEMICVINPSLTKEISVNVAFSSTKDSDYDIASKSYATNPTFDVAAGTVTVPANSYVVLVNSKVLDVNEISTAGDDLLSAYGARGEIVVNNAPSGVRVYSLDGALRHSDASLRSGHIALPAGVYIVNSGNATAKVLVR